MAARYGGSRLFSRRVGITAKEFIGVVGVVDFGRPGAIGPSEPPAVGNYCAQLAVGCHGVVAAAAEVQFVGVGAAAAGEVR
jgi:hypothetical protein